MSLPTILLLFSLSGQTPVFQVDVEAVQIDVFVGRKGKAVLDLGSHDFQVYDNGVLQKVEMIDTEEEPLGAFLVFDTSSSVRGRRLEHLKAAARTFLEGLEEKDQAALVSFSSYLHLQSNLADNMEILRKEVAGIEASGLTCLYDALYAGLTLAERVKRPLILLFTDGHDTFSWFTDADVLEAVAESNAVVYVVRTDNPMVTSPWDPRTVFLREIAEITAGRLLRAESSFQLEEIFRRILAEMKARYLLSYFPEGVDQKGWHRIEVEIKGRDLDVRAKRGYWRRARPVQRSKE